MSGLPSGYTQLEYIESSGTQYINTGFKPKSSTKVMMDFQVMAQPKSHQIIFGERTSYSDTDQFVLGYTGHKSPAVWRSDFGSSQVSFPSTVLWSTRMTAVRNGPDCTLNGTAVKNSSAVFSSTHNLFLLTNNDNEMAAGHISAKLFSCQIFDGDVRARSFVPCKNASGAVGLYDTVDGQFYANAGTGSFTAGPEVVYEPDAPTNFAASVSGQAVALSWAASANAAGYRLKRDGVQIADQTGTTYTDTVPDGTTLCTYALTAYNDAGESAAVTLLVLVQLELITDRTRADVANQTDKGFYNASDLNRVGAAVEYIAGRFTALGYACPVTVKKDWLTSDAPTASQLETYQQNIVTLRGQIAVMQSTPEAPASMAGLNYVKANNIEQILLDLDALIDNITKSWYFSGEVYAGEV